MELTAAIKEQIERLEKRRIRWTEAAEQRNFYEQCYVIGDIEQALATAYLALATASKKE